MSSRPGRAQRALRGVGAAAVATFVASVSHAAAAGHPASWVSVILALSVAAPICVLLAGRTLSWWRLSTAVVLSQALFHALLSLDPSGAGGLALEPAHHMHGMDPSAAAGGSAALAVHGDTAAWMWIAHAAAAVVTILALGRGEQAVRAMIRLLRHPFQALARFTTPPRVGVPALVASVPGRPAQRRRYTAARRRGPPLTA